MRPAVHDRISVASYTTRQKSYNPSIYSPKNTTALRNVTNTIRNYSTRTNSLNIQKGEEVKTATKKNTKYLYGWKLYVNYGQGWEYEIFEELYLDYLVNRKAYRDNCPYPQKWTRGRETNPDYKAPSRETTEAIRPFVESSSTLLA